MLSKTEIFKAIYGSNHFPNLKWHPSWVKEANKTYSNLSKAELDAYYNTLLNAPTPDEKEKHRHISTASVLTQQYPSDFVRELGQFKEYSDLKEGQSKDNSLFDMGNNEWGISIGEKYPDINRQSIYDYVIKQIRNDIKKK